MYVIRTPSFLTVSLLVVLLFTSCDGAGVQQADRGHTAHQLRIWWPSSTHPYLDFSNVDAYCQRKNCEGGKWWHHGPGRYETPGSFQARASELRKELFSFGQSLLTQATAVDTSTGEGAAGVSVRKSTPQSIDFLCGDSLEITPPPTPSITTAECKNDETSHRMATVLLVSHGGILRAAFGDERRFDNGEFRVYDVREGGTFERVLSDRETTWTDVDGEGMEGGAVSNGGGENALFVSIDGRSDCATWQDATTRDQKSALMSAASAAAAATISKIKTYAALSPPPSLPDTSASSQACLQFHSVVQEVRDSEGNHHYHIVGSVDGCNFEGKYRLSEMREHLCSTLRRVVSKQCFESLGEFPSKRCSRLLVMQWLRPWLDRVSAKTDLTVPGDSNYRTDAMKIITVAREYFCVPVPAVSMAATAATASADNDAVWS